MVEINPLALVMAIQAVDHMIDEITKDVEPQDMDKDDAEIYMAYWKSAIEMKRAYLEACKTIINLPRYEDLAKNTSD